MDVTQALVLAKASRRGRGLSICQRMPLGHCGREQSTKPPGDRQDKTAAADVIVGIIGGITLCVVLLAMSALTRPRRFY